MTTSAVRRVRSVHANVHNGPVRLTSIWFVDSPVGRQMNDRALKRFSAEYRTQYESGSVSERSNRVGKSPLICFDSTIADNKLGGLCQTKCTAR